MPARSATRATAGSPSCCIIRVKPVGANANGCSDRLPSTVVEVSSADTSCRIRGRNSICENRSRARRSATSSSAAPSV
jgi:hypothetical protein